MVCPVHHRFYKTPRTSKHVPIARDYRSRWSVKGNHNGHSVWQSEDANEGIIHGSIVGVHIESCVGCMNCIEACPTNVFSSWIDEHEREVVDPTRESECIFCLICELVCPTDAINVTRNGGSKDTMVSLLLDESEY